MKTENLTKADGALLEEFRDAIVLAGAGGFLDFAAQVDAEMVRMGYAEEPKAVAVEPRKT